MSLAELDAIKARAMDTTSHADTALSQRDVPRLVATVEAVLELHQPYITRSAWQTCNECWNSGTAEIVYPCPTVATVEWVLKEEQ